MASQTKQESGLSEADQVSDLIADFADQITLAKRSELKCEKNHYYFMVSGIALAEVNKRASELLNQGTLWNSSELASSKLVALNQCSILKFSAKTLKGVSDYSAYTQLFELQSRQLQAARARIVTNQNLEAAEKVASLMLELSQDQYEFLVLPTQVELSDILGISREALNKSIRSFIKKGWMVKLGRTHKITNRIELTEFAEKPLS